MLTVASMNPDWAWPPDSRPSPFAAGAAALTLAAGAAPLALAAGAALLALAAGAGTATGALRR
jgi:hypothetical protein